MLYNIWYWKREKKIRRKEHSGINRACSLCVRTCVDVIVCVFSASQDSEYSNK